jgi:aspartate kinase
MTKRVVVKFGGAELCTSSMVRKAAEMVIESGYEEIVVVVSAMGKATDNLVGCLSEIGNISDIDYSDILAMGERISARIFCSTLKSLGVKSTYFDPQQERWPIITDANLRGAKPDLAETRARLLKNLEPLLGDYIPVVCGFIGKDREGRVTILRRGGSDTTATLIGNCLRADEIILVKNTEGVLSADPKIVPHAKPLTKLTVKEMFSLSCGGAKIIHSEALKYKLPRQKLTVVNFSYGKLSAEGTEITGVFKFNPMEIKSYRGLTALTLIGNINTENLCMFYSNLGKGKILGVSTGGNSLSIFTRAKVPSHMVKRLHDLGCFKAVTLLEDIGAIEFVNPDFIDSPGWIARISGALANKGINILEMTTNKATINVFVDEKKLDEAVTAVGDLIEK